MYKVCEVQISYRPRLERSRHPFVKNSRDIEALRWDIYDEDEIEYREIFAVLLLNRAGRLIGISRVAEGGITATTVDPRLIVQRALLANADYIILTHNHPSGSLRASVEDQKLTKKISEAAALFDIRVSDHIIMTADGYYSFADHGLL